MKDLIRRTVLAGLLGAGLTGARAAEWPEKGMPWVVPFPASREPVRLRGLRRA